MYQKILVPLDGSDLAESSLKHVRAIAKGCNIPEVVLLRVISRPYFVGGEGDIFPTDIVKKEMARLQSEAKDYLNKLAKELQKEGIAAQAIVQEGYVAEEILEYAEKNDVDLIIMSTHGRSGLARWALGSVADRVVSYSTVPVMVVSPPGYR